MSSCQSVTDHDLEATITTKVSFCQYLIQMVNLYQYLVMMTGSLNDWMKTKRNRGENPAYSFGSLTAWLVAEWKSVV